MNEKIIARFWSRVDRRAPDECWPWTAYRNRKGYGLFWNGRRTTPAGQAALEIDGRPVPSGMYACHRCDNPPCCNPAHLFVGTSSENTRDAFQKGRKDYRGEGCPRAKLTVGQVIAIRLSDETQRVLAERYGVSPATISHARTGRNWRHL